MSSIYIEGKRGGEDFKGWVELGIGEGDGEEGKKNRKKME